MNNEQETSIQGDDSESESPECKKRNKEPWNGSSDETADNKLGTSISNQNDSCDYSDCNVPTNNELCNTSSDDQQFDLNMKIKQEKPDSDYQLNSIHDFSHSLGGSIHHRIKTEEPMDSSDRENASENENNFKEESDPRYSLDLMCSAIGCSHKESGGNCVLLTFPENMEWKRRWAFALQRCYVEANGIPNQSRLWEPDLLDRLCECHFSMPIDVSSDKEEARHIIPDLFELPDEDEDEDQEPDTSSGSCDKPRLIIDPDQVYTFSQDYIEAGEKVASCKVQKERRKYYCRKECGKVFLSWKSRSYHENGPAHNTTASFVCHCGKAFFRKTSLKRHMVIHLDDSKIFKCEYCRFSTSRKDILGRHKCRWINCDICEEEFDSKAAMKRHRQEVHSGKLYSCPHCKSDFKTRRILENHVAGMHNKEEYNCQVCGKNFKWKFSLYRHIKKSHEGLSIEEVKMFSSVEGKVFSPQQEEILKFEEGKIINTQTNQVLNAECSDKIYICPHCKSEFRTKRILDVHIAGMHCNEEHKCEHCGKVFKWKFSLQRHVKKRHEESFKWKFSLCRPVNKTPEGVSTEEAKMSTSADGTVSSPKQETILKFEELHADDSDRDYSCPHCNSDFKTKSILDVHIAGMHNNEEHKCEHCGKVFKWKFSFQRHVKRMHQESIPKDNEGINTETTTEILNPEAVAIKEEIFSDDEEEEDDVLDLTFKKQKRMFDDSKETEESFNVQNYIISNIKEEKTGEDSCFDIAQQPFIGEVRNNPVLNPEKVSNSKIDDQTSGSEATLLRNIKTEKDRDFLNVTECSVLNVENDASFNT